MNNEKGFIFPFTLLMITVAFLLLTTHALRYEKEIVMTKNIQNQYIIESLFALAIDKKETDLIKDDPLPPQQKHTFNQGKVMISYKAFQNYFRVQFLITLKNGNQYIIYKSYPWVDNHNENQLI